MLRALRLLDDEVEVDPLQAECNHRLICTMILMDRLLSFPLRLTPHFAANTIIPHLMADEEFWSLKRRVLIPPVRPHKSINQHIMAISEILVDVFNWYRERDPAGSLARSRVSFDQFIQSLDKSLVYNKTNLERHRQHHSLRKFAKMHLLYHHLGMLIHFDALKSSRAGSEISDTLECHHHATSVVEIVEYCWVKAEFDLHNFSMGQILIVATIVHAHALLTTQSVEVAAQLRTQVRTIRECIVRLQSHTRLFNWVVSIIKTLLVPTHPNTF